MQACINQAPLFREPQLQPQILSPSCEFDRVPRDSIATSRPAKEDASFSQPTPLHALRHSGQLQEPGNPQLERAVPAPQPPEGITSQHTKKHDSAVALITPAARPPKSRPPSQNQFGQVQLVTRHLIPGPTLRAHIWRFGVLTTCLHKCS